MSSKTEVENFVSQKKIAVIGASRNKNKFGFMACKELNKKGYELFPVNPHAENIDGLKCFSDIEEIPVQIDAALLVVPPAISEEMVKKVAAKGIKNVWLQQGAESDSAINFCRQNNINVVHGECIIMFAEPVASFHKFHRWIWKILGKLPN